MDKYIGIDLGGSKIRFNDVDAKGNAGKEHQVLLPSGASKHYFEDVVVGGIDRIISRVYQSKDEVAGIGFGSPGPLDYRRGIIDSPPNLPNLVNWPIIKIIGEFFPNIPAYLVHDADAALLAEHWLGAAKDFRHVAMVTVGTGLGFAVMSDGNLIRGKGRAAEAGHTDISGGSYRLCSCGRPNHWESFVSTEGLARTYCSFFGINFDVLTSEDRYKVSFELRKWLSGTRVNQRWKLLLDEYCKHVVLGLRNIMCNFDPECIVFGGGIMNGNDLLLDEIKNAWKKFMFNGVKDSMTNMARSFEIKLAQLPNAGVIGAAKYAMDMLREEEIKVAGGMARSI